MTEPQSSAVAQGAETPPIGGSGAETNAQAHEVDTNTMQTESEGQDATSAASGGDPHGGEAQETTQTAGDAGLASGSSAAGASGSNTSNEKPVSPIGATGNPAVAGGADASSTGEKVKHAGGSQRTGSPSKTSKAAPGTAADQSKTTGNAKPASDSTANAVKGETGEIKSDPSGNAADSAGSHAGPPTVVTENVKQESADKNVKTSANLGSAGAASPMVATPNTMNAASTLAFSRPSATYTGGGAPSSVNINSVFDYLENVKSDLEDSPQIFSRLLQIMEDYKNCKDLDAIDVIQRVTTLLRSHRHLITQLNPFLPEGYKVALVGDKMVNIETPLGKVDYALAEENGTDSLKSASNIINSMGGSGNEAETDVSGASKAPKQESAKTAAGVPAQEVAQTESGDNNTQKSPVEFDHAIQYVNKVKKRYIDKPDVYRQFLDILQVYQKEKKPIEKVYEQVHELLSDSPDLLAGFQQFLPNSNGEDNNESEQSGYAPYGPNDGQYPNGQGAPQAAAPAGGKRGQKKNAKNSNATQQFNSNQHPEHSQSMGPIPPHDPAMMHDYMSGPPPPHGPPGPMGLPYDGYNGGPPPKGMKRPYNDAPYYNGPPMRPPMPGTPGINGPPLKHAKKAQPQEELLFFEKCKRVIGNKQIYNEFLKILNLYSQEIIESKVLVERVEPFLGKSPELFEWFKKFVKYEEEETIFNIPIERARLDLRNEKQHGRSYRRIPDDVPRLKCSGRDELDREVLNDDWLSVPIYVSETGFVSHKKTQFEEALHQCEEQRYEFDMNINNNLHTIALLEPIARKIQKMTAEEKTKFKLDEGLGGFSKSIYKKVIKLVYDKDRGLEVIDALHNNPAVAVPVVLNRLKQKDQEWRRLQREWNKVWRDIDNKNYYRALDHQSSLFKSNDKKHILPKNLTSQIENIVKEQQEQFIVQQQQHEKEAQRLVGLYRDRMPNQGKSLDSRKEFLKAIETHPEPASADLNLGSMMPGSVPSRIDNFTTIIDPETCKVLAIGNSPQTERYQFEFLFRDKEIFDDIRHLINKINKNGDSDDEDEPEDGNKSSPSSSVALDDSAKQKEILKGFVGILFDNLTEENLDQLNDENDASMEIDTANAVGQDINGKPLDTTTSTNDSLRHTVGKSSIDNFAADGTDNEKPKKNENTIKSCYSSGSTKNSNRDYFPLVSGFKFPLPKRSSFVLYGGSNFYYFIRLYQILYVRLYKLKQLSKKLLEDPPRWTRKSALAQKLGLQSKALDEYLTVDRYSILLKLIEDFAMNNIESGNFEETCRRMFGTGAYIIFTVDKVLNGIVRQINNFSSDVKNLEFLERFYIERGAENPNEAEYRLFSEKELTEDKIYRFEYFVNEEVLTTKLLTKSEYLTEQLLTPSQEWSLYVDSFIQSRETRPSLLGVPGSTKFSGLSNPNGLGHVNYNLANIYDTRLAQVNGLIKEDGNSDFAQRRKKPFLNRNLPKDPNAYNAEDSKDVITSSALQLKICSNTYKMFFMPDTEDYFIRLNRNSDKIGKKTKLADSIKEKLNPTVTQTEAKDEPTEN